MILFWALSAKIVSKVFPTVFSDIVNPGLIALVESHMSASTPFLPNSANLARSIVSPYTGVKSTLKSPVWITVPAGEWMASAHASAMLWFVLMNSTLKSPRLMFWP